MAQMNYLIHAIKPIKDKILCAIPGNHEEKFRINNSIDLMYMINHDLKIPVGDYMSFLKIKFDRHQFQHAVKPMTIWLQHGWFAGRKMGGKVNQLMDVANTYEADMYLSGHSHDLFATTLERMTVPERTLDIIKTKKTFINTGTFLETVTKRGTSYGEMKAYPVAKIGSARIKIYPRRTPLQSDVHVSI
jgi:predicted phosphodiesterase